MAHKPPAKKPPPKPLADRVAHDPALLKRALADPGLRSKLPPKYLSPAQRQTRTTNFQDAQPVVPGSTMTGKDLRHQLNAAVTLQYGPDAEAKQAQQAKDVGGWWQQWQNELQGHYANDAQIKQQADTAIQNLVGAVGGAAAPTGGQSADAQRMAGQAATVRQGILGSQGVEQSTQAGNAVRQAETLANVVAPTQKLAGQVGETKKLNDLRATIGAFKTKTSGDIKAGESQAVAEDTKNQLAAKIAGVNTQATQAKTQKTQADLDFFNKHGYYPPTGPPKKPGAKTGYGAGGPGLNKYGYTYDEWTGLSASAKSKARAGKGKDKKDKPPVSGPGSLSSAQESKFVSQINKVYGLLTNPQQQVKDANGNVKLKKITAAQMLAQLRSQGVDPRVLNVARSLLHNKGKGIGDFGLSAAHDLGIHVAPHWQVIR